MTITKINNLLLLLIVYLSLNTLVTASDNTQILTKIDQAYTSFDYNSVINICQKTLQDSTLSDPDLLAELYRFMGLSYYALGEMGPSYNRFHQLLVINPRYQLDPAVTPPKILRFFNEIKTNMDQSDHQTTITLMDTIYQYAGPEKKSIVYSFILPGSGHLREGFKTKGWILTGAALATLGSSVYLIVETNRLEKEYLNTVNKDLIEQKYQDYNDVYRWRNISLGLYAGIWLYSQIDLLLISTNENYTNTGLRLKPVMFNEHTPAVLLSYQF